MSSPIAGTQYDQRTTITPKECEAMQLLYRDNWDANVLAMIFEISESKLWVHINGECNHQEPA